MPRLAALALLIVCALVVPASAGPLSPTRPSQLVTLHPTTSTSSDCGQFAYPVDMMRNLDGSLAPLEVPPNQVLIVTSADFWGVAVPQSRRYQFFLSVATAPSIPGGALLAGDAGLADPDGNYAGSVSVTGGVVVPPGGLLCVHIDGSSEQPTFARVHGFFAKKR